MAGAVKAVLGLGGNLGDPAEAFRQAAELLATEEGIEILASAPLYRSAPWGNTDQPEFLNSALLVETELSPRQMLKTILKVEQKLGRVRSERWGPRLIDIDVLVWDEAEISEEALAIPHPHLSERGFALKPLADLWPEAKVKGRTARALLAEVDTSDLVEAAPGGWHRG
ncbi:2-amino-4-hydroxy-6-hydroxymethyldihydropteridine diphosphokinase [Afifella sp. IM 167]|uniref:2-amino-4-hydroxy-6- hydroxymethyldihydropteridine diphosphokinase n=1 Tax=Afifella sp. IM 167 TaxID=2033586 RepID=UPI001CCC34A2|nr:2-amino-4-hydroxy-6-hydroxymethyldihydropteridine diphosphokinase [Afifella sp. IM 167]